MNDSSLICRINRACVSCSAISNCQSRHRNAATFKLWFIPRLLHSAIMSDVTRLLEAAAAGDRKAAAELLPLVYDELRKLAAVKMTDERSDHTLDATALVHEAYVRLVVDQQFDGRGHFFAVAAEAMRRVLVDHARNRNRLKRAGGRIRVDLDSLTDLASTTDEDLLGLDDALDQLAKDYPIAAELVKLRFFAGMTLSEAAETLGLADRTADRYWLFARTWLADALGQK